MNTTDFEFLFKVVGSVVFTLALFAFVAAIGIRGRRRLRSLEQAWRGYAGSRGFTHREHSGAAWLDARFGGAPHMRGVVDGLPIDVVASATIRRSASSRSDSALRYTLASAPIVTTGAGPIREDTLGAEAARMFEWLKAKRPDIALEVWPTAGGGHHVIVGWFGLEHDTDVLDAALRLLVRVAQSPPTSFAEIPWQRRRAWGGDW